MNSRNGELSQIRSSKRLGTINREKYTPSMKNHLILQHSVWYIFLNDISDESDACQVTGGSSKCPCQDGYEGDPCRGECQSKLALFVLTNICRICWFLWMWEDTSFSKLERFKVVTRACHPTLFIMNVQLIIFIFDRYRRVFNEHPQL